MSILSKLLGAMSGDHGLRISEQLLFDKVIGFKGVVPGVGTSTIVQNTAIAIAENTNFSVCVLDTNFLYPTQYPMLISTPDSPRKDFLEYSGVLSDVALETSHKNVALIAMSERSVVDMLSSKDNEMVIDKVLGSLKSYFDIILVDLSHEITHISTYAAIKCNKIIVVTDQSLKSIYHFRKSINTMATMAIPVGKADKVILNKVVPDVITDTLGVITDAGLEVLGTIPLSYEIAKQGVSGKRVYVSGTSNKDIHAFSTVIHAILKEIVQVTPLISASVGKNRDKGKKEPVTDNAYDGEITFETGDGYAEQPTETLTESETEEYKETEDVFYEPILPDEQKDEEGRVNN